MVTRCVSRLQGSSAFARAGRNARVAGLVGLGKQAKAAPVTEWGPSPFQVSPWAVAPRVSPWLPL